MQECQKSLSVAEAADLCAVGRTTVGYWIRSKKLAANRRGKKYEIPIQNLLYFLKFNGQQIPAQLEKENLNRPVFKAFQNCWAYHRDHCHGTNCKQCIVFKNKLGVCFSARSNGNLNCVKECENCSYYREAFFPRIQFIYQFGIPAAIVKDLYFWAANPEMADLCQKRARQLVGMGIERIVHRRSLEHVISFVKRKALEMPGTQSDCWIYIKNQSTGGMKIKCSVSALKEPQGALLVMAAPDRNHHSLD
ncbi:MAG: helix-turn-helix domain-containing protein [Desulfobacterales bacterium]|jgi:excisionase family DNA binding protein